MISNSSAVSRTRSGLSRRSGGSTFFGMAEHTSDQPYDQPSDQRGAFDDNRILIRYMHAEGRARLDTSTVEGRPRRERQGSDHASALSEVLRGFAGRWVAVDRVTNE